MEKTEAEASVSEKWYNYTNLFPHQTYLDVYYYLHTYRAKSWSSGGGGGV